MRIFVTGATGFVGPKVVHALRAQDRDVRALVRRPARAAQLANWGVDLATGDVTDPVSVREGLRGCTHVVHLVAIIQGRPQDFDRIMTQGTRDLVQAAKEAGVRRFVLMSALGTSEETKDLVPYFRAKWDMERTVEASGIEHVTFRPSFVFGREGGILPTFARLARLTPITPITGPGTQRIQPIWVDDVAEFFVRAVDEPAVANRTWELGGPDAVSWNEFWERLKSALGVRRPSIHMPMALMRLNARVTERLPGDIPLTRDLLKMLEAGDNTTDVRPAVEAFGIALAPLDEQLRRGTGRA